MYLTAKWRAIMYARYCTRKTWMIMRLAAIFLILSTLSVHARGTAQTITVNETNVPLQKVIKVIQQQTGYGFNYKAELLEDLPMVTVKVVGKSLKETLEQALRDLPISFFIGEKFVVLNKKKEKDIVAEIVLNALPDTMNNIVGYVLDGTGNPLNGATVTLKRSSRIVAYAAANGRFEIKGGEVGDVFMISFIGYETQEFVVKSKQTHTIRLSASDSKLDEVQVIAYGVVTRRLATGNVSSVKATDIEKQPVNNPLLALQGRVPGLTVVQNTGIAGGGITVRIQGQNSIRSGNDPLYVVDGVPINSQLPRTSLAQQILGTSGAIAPDAPPVAGNPLNYLNPADIESIDVLKDADATAIYGSRAANGALLITTKKGKAGRMKADMNVQTGWGKIGRKLQMLNTRQYLDMRYEAYKNDNVDWRTAAVSADDLKVWDTTRYTDWQSELIGNTARYLSVNATVSAGSAGTQYLIGATYNRETTVFPGDFSNKRGSLHFNINSVSSNQKFRLQFSGNYMTNNNRLPKADLTQAALLLEPDAPMPFKTDGTLNWAPNAAGASTFTRNPYINILQGYKNTTTNLINNIVIGYKLLPGLELTSSLGYTYMQTEDFNSTSTATIVPESRVNTPNSASYGSRNLNSWIIEPQITYKRSISKSRLDLLIGSTILESNAKTSSLSGTTYASDALLENFQSAGTLIAGSATATQYKYNAIFGRLNYNWQDQYILNITSRRDGSSRFGGNNRFHNFMAVGGAWLFVKSSFIQQNLPWLSFGKLRASYGTTGNDQIADYLFISRYSNISAQVPYQGVSGLYPNGLPNPNLEWEKTKKLAFGIDAGIIRDRILISANYSINTSDNQLNSYLLPSVTGFQSVVKNFPGTVRNTSWEFSISTENIKNKSLQWSTSINLTIPKNKLVAFPGLESSPYASLLVIGESLSVQRVTNFAGVNSVTGLYQFRDLHGSVTGSPAYQADYISVNTAPKWYGGIQNNLRYKDIQLDFLLQLVNQIGPNILFGNGTSVATPGSLSKGASNQPVTVLDRWRIAGDNASIKKFSSKTSDVNAQLAYSSDARYSDASFARIKNVSLSWQLPAEWLKKSGIQGSKFFIQVQNLLTITSYKGLDPENQSISSLPPLRVVMLGIQLVL